MAEFPALSLWTDSYLADTRHLSTLEHGAYLLLLIEAWRRPRCDLPDDDAILARLAGLSGDEWQSIKPTVMAFWRRDGRCRTWTQKRLSKERDRARIRSKSASDKALKRWKREQNADAAALPEECREDAPTTTTIITPSVETSSTAAAAVPNLFDHAEDGSPAGAKPTSSPPPSSSAIDVKRAVFDRGIAMLVEQGIPEPRARSIVGKWCKDHGSGATLDAIARAEVEGPPSPLEYITGCLNYSKGPRNGHVTNGARPGAGLGTNDIARQRAERRVGMAT
jgi:uncharacterized protein YdaU (DUF1376 family)